MKLSAIKQLSEASSKFDLHVMDPYGNGLDPEPVKVGEVIMDDDNNGDDVTFMGVTDDGKRVIIQIEVSPDRVSGKIFPKGQGPKKK
jgi:hypothetical protein